MTAEPISEERAVRTVILSPCGILGYGFPESSFRAAMKEEPDAIIVDAGSTDAGPHKLGAGVAIVSRQAARKDLSLLMEGARAAGIPLLIGSAGGSGARKHVEWTFGIIREIAAATGWRARVAVVWADIPDAAILDALREGRVEKMSPNVGDLDEETLGKTNGVVAQMGAEPILKALGTGAEIILCGRAYDPAPFAAFGIAKGGDEAPALHLGKILECGALCAEPGSAKDCMIGILDREGFEVFPADPALRCTRVSVAAHTFYEKDHPFLLRGPGTLLDLSGCAFRELGGGRVRVEGSRVTRVPYAVKLEGARLKAYRSFVLAGIRDPLLISRLDEVERGVEKSVRAYYGEIPREDYRINFIHYGLDGVLGAAEPCREAGHEIGLMFEVLAKTQDIADAVCASVRSTYLHWGYPGRKSTAGNLAFPFAPSDIRFGAVYEFSVYHLMRVDDPCALFPVEVRTV